MQLLMITYALEDLSDERRRAVGAQIASLGDVWHDPAVFRSVWWVATEKNPDEACGAIEPTSTQADQWYIVDLTDKRAQGEVPAELWRWLTAHRGR